MAIRNPIVWSYERAKLAAGSVGSARPEEYWAAGKHAAPQIRKIGIADLQAALRSGFDDFSANRTDVIFLCLLYPLVGLVLARLAFGYGVLPLLFPLAAGFALVGPLAAVGLNEMSRRRELGQPASWVDAFRVLRSPSIGGIALLGALLIVIFGLWIMAAAGIYQNTMGPEAPISAGQFFSDVFNTEAGWAMILIGCGVGFLFAVVVLAISVVSFPLLLDRPAGFDTAIRTSVRACAANPVAMAGWGLIVAAGLVLGSIPLLLGLAVVLPVLGHATWHLYRRVVVS